MSCRFLAAVTVVAGLALATAPAIAQQPHPGGPGSKAAPTLPPPPPSGPESHALPTPPPPPSGPGVLGETPLSVDAMVAGVNSRLDDAVGYAYTIARNGQVVAEDGVGQARRAVDGTRAFTPTTRLEVMSVTKNMTAIALLKLLQAEAVSIDSPIARWLPLDWPKAGGFKRASQTPITFRHLLTHTSGVNQAIVAAPPGSGVGNSWSGLRALVALGATPNAAPDNYKNANYALMRVLIPRLTGQRVVTEQRAYKRYLLWLNEAVFEPSGVASVSCWESDDSNAALTYNVADPAAAGWLVEREGAERVHCGGHTGLHLSSRDLARVLVHLRHTTALLPADARAAMLADRLGWNEGSNNGDGRTDTLNVWWHGGDGDFNGGREIHTCVMALPQGYEAALVVNSQPGGACGVLLDSYKEAAAG